MRMIAILLGFVAGLAAFLLPSSSPISAQGAAALSGKVSSAREGADGRRGGQRQDVTARPSRSR